MPGAATDKSDGQPKSGSKRSADTLQSENKDDEPLTKKLHTSESTQMETPSKVEMVRLWQQIVEKGRERAKNVDSTLEFMLQERKNSILLVKAFGRIRMRAEKDTARERAAGSDASIASIDAEKAFDDLCYFVQNKNNYSRE